MEMCDGRSGQLKKFVFRTKAVNNGEYRDEYLEIFIPELLQASYSFYTWPSAPVLAWFLWEQRQNLPGKHILELGSGTALPGILAAKCGASVTLSDSFSLSKSLQHISKCCEANGLAPGHDIKIHGITWGLFLGEIFNIEPQDLIISSDCFYEPSVFEDILVTVAYFVELNPDCKFICTYQERSSDWSIEALLKKWNLKCSLIDLESHSQSTVMIMAAERSEMDDESSNRDFDNDIELDIEDESESDLDSLFNRAANHLTTIVSKVEGPTLLKLYSYYKQGNEGPCQTVRPSWYDFQGKQKWDAWNGLGELPSEEAKRKYIDLINNLSPDWNTKDSKNKAPTWTSVSVHYYDDDCLPECEKSIFDYCKENNVTMVSKILNHDVNQLDDDGLALIHWACDRGHVDMLKVLVENKCDINILDPDGQTALHYAVSCGYSDCVKYLLDNGADSNVKDNDGNTACSFCSDDAILQLFKQ